MYLSKIIGIALCALAIAVLSGWALGYEAMVRIVPGSVAMGVNTALMFFVSGMAIGLATQKQHTLLVEKLCALTLIILSGLILIEYIFVIDLGIDLRQMHATVNDGNPLPGRTAPNTCLAFLATGIVFMLQSNQVWRQRAKPVIAVLIAFIFLIGCMASLGYLLNLEAMYQIASYNRMAAPTAIGVTLIGIALWQLRHNSHAETSGTFQNEDKRITKYTATVLVVVAITAGLTGFAVLRQGFEESAADAMHNTAINNAVIISDMLDHAVLLANSVTDRPALKRYLIKINAATADEESLALIQEVGNSFIPLGFTGINIYDAKGDLLANTGSMQIAHAAIATKLLPPNDNSLLFWRDGFLLKTETYARHRGQVIGRFVTEQRLTPLTKLVMGMQRGGRSHDLLLCGRNINEAVCYPTRFYSADTRIPMFKPDGSPTLPISRALLGQSGAYTVNDLRGIKVLAGYAPLAKYGLALVVKADVQELYSYQRDRLNLLVVLLIILVIIGTLVLQRQVQPLIARIIAERRRIKVILENSSDAFVSIDHRGLITDWNAQAERTFGWSKQEAIGRDMASLLVPESQREQHNAGFRRFIGTGTGPVINNRLEVTALHKNGKEIPVELAVAAHHDGKGYAANAFLRDITERKRAEKTALFIEKERLRVTLNSIGDAVISTDIEGNITYLNPVAEAMTGWTNDEAVGLPLSMVFHIANDKADPITLSSVEAMLRQEYKIGLGENTMLIQRDGAQIPIEDSASPIRDAKGDIIGMVLVFRDVSQARKMVAQMTHQATHDSLTGLINRSEFERGLELILQGQQNVAHTLLYLDLDQFKIVNDTCGHMAGDVLLQQLTGVLQKIMRKNDIFARLGGR